MHLQKVERQQVPPWVSFVKSFKNPFGRKTQVLQVRHPQSGLDVNIVFGSLPFEHEVVARAIGVDVGGVEIPLPHPEDMIVLQAVAHRPQDLEDIESILAAQPRLNLTEMLNRVQEFASALEMPEILTDLETLILQRRVEEYR